VCSRSVVLLWCIVTSLLSSACASVRPFEQPRQAMPQARFVPLTELPGEPGEGSLRRANEQRLSAAKEAFRDLDPQGWQGTGPWWLRETVKLVPYVDGQTVLIAVGEAKREAGMTKEARRLAAEERARSEAAKAFRAIITRVAGGRPSHAAPPAEHRLKRAVADSTFEHGDRAWVLLVCDRDCLESNGRAAKVTLSGVALVPGEP
jgi:hypothetical protein